MIAGTTERLRLKEKVDVLLCSSHRSTRPPEAHEVLLNGTDGLDWETLCKCDLLYAVDKRQLTHRRGSVSTGGSITTCHWLKRRDSFMSFDKILFDSFKELLGIRPLVERNSSDIRYPTVDDRRWGFVESLFYNLVNQGKLVAD